MALRNAAWAVPLFGLVALSVAASVVQSRLSTPASLEAGARPDLLDPRLLSYPPSEKLRDSRIAAGAAASLEITDLPCGRQINPPAALGKTSFAESEDRLFGLTDEHRPALFERHLDRYLDSLRWSLSVDVWPAPTGHTGPLRRRHHRPSDATGYWPYGEHFASLIVDEWRDPATTPSGEIRPGEIKARLLVWSYADRDFVCASDVVARNGPLTIVKKVSLEWRPERVGQADPEDDPITKARLDLVVEALRAGLTNLRQLKARPAGEK
jgi:hypothetical protein